MEKNRVSFQFAGTNTWFTCDEDKLEVTLAKARQANGLISTHEVEIVRPNNEVETQAKQKTKKEKTNGTINTTSADNSTDSNFDSNIDIYNALSTDTEDNKPEQEAI